MPSATNDKLVADVKMVLDDAESLLKQAADSTGTEAAALRDRGMSMLREAGEKAHHLQEVVVAKGKAAARATDDYVHDHPWRVVSLSFGAGLLIGLLLNRAR
ncbi:MAG: DUF883 domain-containing protein [Burkholderiaceae bacterium]|nr:DUF883 domain-containing protein [Burkholderiaceae bacterium]MBP7660193.1 DUF883 domain-containing protein [Burkholderiaceae bacterium]